MPPQVRRTFQCKTARREMTDAEKGMIIAFFYTFQKISTVADLVGRPWSTVRNFLERACDRGSMDNKPRSGRPPLLSNRERRTVTIPVSPVNACSR